MKGKILLICLISVVILPIYGVEQIPEWVKNNAKLWSENQIDNESYFNALEFLIENNIIQFEYVKFGEQRVIINSTSEIFHAWSYEDDFYLEFEKSVSRDIHFKLM